MKSHGNQLDLYDHAPARMLKAAEEALETAKIDPQFWGVVRQDRVNHYEKEVERWRGICDQR